MESSSHDNSSRTIQRKKLGKRLQKIEKKQELIANEIASLLETQYRLDEEHSCISEQIESLRKNRTQNLKWSQQHFPWSDDLCQIAKERWGIKNFRPKQEAAMNAILSGENVFLVMPTGGGKSLCYQIPAVITPNKLTVVISPLLSLSYDQVSSLSDVGIRALTLNAETSKEATQLIGRCAGKKSDKKKKEQNSNGKDGKNQTENDSNKDNLMLLYLTPEKLVQSKRLLGILEKLYKHNVLARFVIDECHLVSQWGHDYRQDYSKLSIISIQFPNIPILAVTATATTEVRLDVQKVLRMKDNCVELTSPFDRPNLKYVVLQKKESPKDALNDVVGFIRIMYMCFSKSTKLFNVEKHKKPSGIIYCLSRKDTENLAKHLISVGISAGAYHAYCSPVHKRYVHDSWSRGHISIICATEAFGMGINKLNVRFVLHQSLPKSMIGYAQQAGRAGRDGNPAICAILYRAADSTRISPMVFNDSRMKALPQLYEVISYCINTRGLCRRSLISDAFGECTEMLTCGGDGIGCDICWKKLEKVEKVEKVEKIEKVENTEKICTKENTTCTNFDLSEYIPQILKTINILDSIDQKVTLLQLAKLWKGIGPLKKYLTRGIIEKIPKPPKECSISIVLSGLAQMLATGVLREIFAHTAYSSNAYLAVGNTGVNIRECSKNLVLSVPLHLPLNTVHRYIDRSFSSVHSCSVSQGSSKKRKRDNSSSGENELKSKQYNKEVRNKTNETTKTIVFDLTCL